MRGDRMAGRINFMTHIIRINGIKFLLQTNRGRECQDRGIKSLPNDRFEFLGCVAVPSNPIIRPSAH